MNVWVSEHAAERFIERVRPSMDRRQARLELARLIREFGRRVDKPEWLEGFELTARRFCVEVSDGIVVIVDPDSTRGSWPLAVTVITRAGHDVTHQGRRSWGRQKRAGARLRKKTERKLPRRSRRDGFEEAA